MSLISFDLTHHYRYTGVNENSNMAIVEVGMLSGWEVHHEMLHHIKQATDLVHDHEIKEDKLHIYFVMVCNGTDWKG